MQRSFFRPAVLALVITLATGAVTAEPPTRQEPTGVLPLWVDAGQAAELWIETCFPRQEEFPLRVPEAARYLIVKLEATQLDDPLQAAFALKNLVVEARSGAARLKVALDGPPDAVTRLVAHGLAPYVDAYVSPRGGSLLPADDPTARLWWRAEAGSEEVLATLLEASAHGVELVVLEDLTIEPAHRELLDKLRALRATDLTPQPAVAGIARERVRFFLDPESGHRYLAVQAEPGRSQRLELTEGEQLTVRELHPAAADYGFLGYGRGGELSLFGDHAHYLFELVSQAPEAPHSRVVVESSEIVDPYEIVVKNQVFQRQQAEKIGSLVVDEKLYTLSQLPRVATLHQPPFLDPLPERAASATFVRAVATLENGEAVEDLRFLEYRGAVDEIEVRLVELYTSVTDPRARFVLGLGQGDFQVLENGAPQMLTRFDTIDRLPIHVALLLDVSGSMEPRLSVATESALRFFDTVIDPEKDRAALLTFNHAVRLRVPFTNDLERLRYGVTDLAAWQGTRLHDGVIHAGHYFGGLAGKRALVLLSDGEDTGSRFLFKQVLEHTLRSGVAVYPIAVDLVDPLTRKRLKQLAAETGGSFYAVDEVEQLDDIYRRLEQELRAQYLLAYHAPDAHRSGFRTVEVRVASPEGGELKARTIHGYYP